VVIFLLTSLVGVSGSALVRFNSKLGLWVMAMRPKFCTYILTLYLLDLCLIPELKFFLSIEPIAG
jgi:hypothetical protein